MKEFKYFFFHNFLINIMISHDCWFLFLYNFQNKYFRFIQKDRYRFLFVGDLPLDFLKGYFIEFSFFWKIIWKNRYLQKKELLWLNFLYKLYIFLQLFLYLILILLNLYQLLFDLILFPLLQEDFLFFFRKVCLFYFY